MYKTIVRQENSVKRLSNITLRDVFTLRDRGATSAYEKPSRSGNKKQLEALKYFLELPKLHHKGA